jgi:hypothetical protein
VVQRTLLLLGVSMSACAGPSLGKCSPCDRTGPLNSRGPQHHVYSLIGIVLVCIFCVGPSPIVAQKAKTRVPFFDSSASFRRSSSRPIASSRVRPRRRHFRRFAVAGQPDFIIGAAADGKRPSAESAVTTV